jgi:DNA recombination protein RmuC
MELVFLVIGLAGGFAVAALLFRRRAEAAAEAAAAREREHAEQRIADIERAAEEKVALVTASREQWLNDLKAISADALRETSKQLAELSDAKIGQRTEEIKRVLQPVSDHLKRVEEQVTKLDREREKTHGTVAEMVRAVAEEVGRLRNETGTLVNALRRPQVRGSWGEMQLRNCVEAANMTPHVDFHDQKTYDDGDGGRLRPDMTVHLPAGRSVVVDSKVPLDAYLAALDAGDDAELRERELDRHARQLRSHLDTLASKAYHARLEQSPEFVVCFIPNEAIYSAALDRDPSLLEHGAAKNVLIATPATLIALLHAVYYGWRQEKIAESAREIADAARELHKRTANFLEPFAKVGRQLRSTTDAYNSAVASLEARLLPQLRRIEEAGAKSEKELAPPAAIDTPPRLVSAPELGRGEDDGEDQLPLSA